MAELPELAILQRQMQAALAGRTIAAVEILQPKCLNVAPDELSGVLVGRTIADVTRRGKWLFLRLEPPHYLLLNLGMGAELWHYRPGSELPGRYQLRLHLDDGSGFTCRFWWFGYVRSLTPDELVTHPETARLGPDPLQMAADPFVRLARAYPGKTAKALLLEQDKVSGIGNAYAHDILFRARLHPQRKVSSLTDADLAALHAGICWVLTRAIDLGGLESDFHRSGGNLTNWDAFSLVGYKEGKPCPTCGTAITKVKTGSTATYICPTCQAAP